MNWVKKHKLPAIKAIWHNGQLYTNLEDLWEALHQSFNLVQNCQVNLDILDELSTKSITIWSSFSVKEFRSTIAKYNNLSTRGPDKLSWKHLKAVVKDDMCLNNLVNIANMCINLGHWLSHFKMSSSIIIPKPNKASYDSPKIFCPIVLLNMIGKLIEEVISKRLQFQVILKNFIHLCQLGGLK